jgi:hypothetical protein
MKTINFEEKLKIPEGEKTAHIHGLAELIS